MIFLNIIVLRSRLASWLLNDSYVVSCISLVFGNDIFVPFLRSTLRSINSSVDNVEERNISSFFRGLIVEYRRSLFLKKIMKFFYLVRVMVDPLDCIENVFASAFK